MGLLLFPQCIPLLHHHYGATSASLLFSDLNAFVEVFHVQGGAAFGGVEAGRVICKFFKVKGNNALVNTCSTKTSQFELISEP